MARNKGQRGEREMAALLSELLDKPVSRNLDQVRDGGYDINQVPGFAFEVKRCQQLTLQTWWTHLIDGLAIDRLPVLAYRQNHQPWRFLLPVGALFLVPPSNGIQDEEEGLQSQLRGAYVPSTWVPNDIGELITLQWPVMGEIILARTLNLEQESLIKGGENLHPYS